MSKGSKRRPMKVSREEFDKNWNNIFAEKVWQHKCNDQIVALGLKDTCPYCGKRLVVEVPKAE